MAITMHMVASLDGFVAAEDEADVSWMSSAWSPFDRGVELTADLMPEIDCYIMGSRTYELTAKLGWPYGETRVIVATRRQLSASHDSVEFYSGDLRPLCAELEGHTAWLVGGPTLYQEFFRLELVDEVCLTVVPVFLGSGLPLYRGDERRLRLKDVTAFQNGMIDLLYDVLPSSASTTAGASE